MPATKFIAADCTGATNHASDAVVLTLFGPKGGTIATAGMTLEKVEQLRDQFNRSFPADPIRALPLDAFAARAEAICESDAVLRSAYTACEWDCLDENGKEWIAAIVREAQAQAFEYIRMVAQLTHRCDPTATGISDESDSDTLDSLIYQARAIVAPVLA